MTEADFLGLKKYNHFLKQLNYTYLGLYKKDENSLK